MNPSDYISIIEKTAVFPKKVDNFGITYAVLGLVDEFNEFVVSYQSGDLLNIPKEAGDVFWHAALFCTETELNFEDLLEVVIQRLSDDEEISTPSKFYGGIVKFYRDNKPLDLTICQDFISIILCDVLGMVLWNKLDKDPRKAIDDLLALNYEKLTKRIATNTIHGDGDNREENSSNN